MEKKKKKIIDTNCETFNFFFFLVRSCERLVVKVVEFVIDPTCVKI